MRWSINIDEWKSVQLLSMGSAVSSAFGGPEDEFSTAGIRHIHSSHRCQLHFNQFKLKNQLVSLSLSLFRYILIIKI